MKKYGLFVILLLLSFIIYGCEPSTDPVDDPIDTIIDSDNDDSDNTDDDDTDDSDNTDDNDDDDTPTHVDPLFTDMVTFPIEKSLYEDMHNTSVDHVQDTLDIYYQEHSVLPYVTLDSIVTLQSDLYTQGTFDYVSEGELITITHTFHSESAYIDDTTHTLIINLTSQMMTFSSRQFAQYSLIDLYEPEYFTYTSFDKTAYQPFTIDLSEYEYELLIEDDMIYMPFDLTNIIFSSDKGFLYYNAESIYLYPGLGFFPEVRNTALEDERPSRPLMNQTLEHMRILFNHYHGVHEYGSGEDFEDFIRLFKTRLLTDYDHYKMIYANISRLDDLHTQYVMNGSWSSYATVPPINSVTASNGLITLLVVLIMKTRVNLE